MALPITANLHRIQFRMTGDQINRSLRSISLVNSVGLGMTAAVNNVDSAIPPANRIRGVNGGGSGIGTRLDVTG